MFGIFNLGLVELALLGGVALVVAIIAAFIATLGTRRDKPREED